MKFVIAALLGGGTLVAAEMPTPGINECAIVSTEIQRGSVTMLNPTPAAESLRIVVYCGHQVGTDTGGVRTERALKVIDVDVAEAEILGAAALELVDNGDVFVGEG